MNILLILVLAPFAIMLGCFFLGVIVCLLEGAAEGVNAIGEALPPGPLIPAKFWWGLLWIAGVVMFVAELRYG